MHVYGVCTKGVVVVSVRTRGEVTINFSLWCALRIEAEGCHATTLYVSGGSWVFLLHQWTNTNRTCSTVPVETRRRCKLGDSSGALNDTPRA
jgi:hypothetical protein